MVAAKRKRVSKKLKVSWRKHTKVHDIEEFLEDQRLEERLGPSLSTLTNDELFQVDTKPTETTAEVTLSSKSKKKLRSLQPPKCFTALRPYTNVPDPITKRNRVRTKEERKNELVKKKEDSRRAQGILRFREKQAIRDKKFHDDKKESEPKRGEFNKNIWDEAEKSEIEKDEWIPEETVKHTWRGTGKIIKTRVGKNKKSGVATIEPPHPGLSYNPSFGDHQELLKIVADKEMSVMKTEKHLERVTTKMFDRTTAQKRDASWMKEMSEGLPQLEVKDEIKEQIDEDDYNAINPPVQNKKKTLKQRRKQKEQQEMKLKAKLAKLEKKKVTDIHRLKMLKNHIEKQETKQTVLREQREKVKKLKENDPKRLSAMKFEEPDLDFNLAEDLQGNLRNLKTEGNLLRDRFKSLQKRNIVQVAVRRNRQKVKVKVYTKPGHKEDWKKTVARPSAKI